MVDTLACVDADVSLDETVLGGLLHLVPSKARPLSPVPGRNEVSPPEAQLGRRRAFFLADVFRRVAAVGHRLAVANEGDPTRL